MGLRQRQTEFARQVPALIDQAFALGYDVTLGDAYRDPRAFGHFGVAGPYGSARSKHKLRLAIDLNLFKRGRYITDDEGHRELGEYWESVGGTWGGRFRDFNHYEWPN